MADIVQGNFLNELVAIDRANLSPAEGYHRKAAILRRTLFHEWLQIAGLQRTLDLLRQAAAIDQPDIRIAREAITAKFNAHLATAHAAEGVLDQMALFPLLPPTFPSYWQLSAEVRVQVLSCLTTATDKWNLEKAFPCEAMMMGWEMEAVRRDAKLELEPLNWGNWQRIGQLRGASEYMRNFVNQRFARHVEKENDFCETTNPNHYLNQFPETSAFDGWSPTDPITAPISFRWTRIARNSVSTRIWACCIEVWGMVPTFQQLTQELAEILAMMPNLHKLVLVIGMHVATTGQLVEIENVALPALPKLTTLKFFNDGNPNSALLRGKLLHAYGPQLRHLHVEGKSDSQTGNQFQQDLPVCNQLTRCTVKGYPSHGWQFYCEMFEKLQDSPLKVLKCSINPDLGTSGLPDFLETVCRHFGDTLEEMWITAEGNGRQVPLAIRWKEDNANMSFAKLKHLTINLGLCANGLEFLLLCPVLETLKFDHRIFGNNTASGDGQGAEQQPILHRCSLCTVSTWKLLPHLREILVEERRQDISGGETKTVLAKITRADFSAQDNYIPFINRLVTTRPAY